MTWPDKRCPNWRRLNARRDRQPEAWDRALAHLEDCPRCCEEALAVEPTLLFKRLPAPAVGSDDVAAMRRAVATLRRTEDLRRTAGRRPSNETAPRARSAGAGALRAAALGAVLIAASLLQGVVPDGGSPPPPAPEATIQVDRSHPFDRMPLVEDLDPAFGSVVQVVDDGLSLVLVLPPSDA